jgi:mannose-6-phosphate isomerase-like protein (cupin superfamily)
MRQSIIVTAVLLGSAAFASVAFAQGRGQQGTPTPTDADTLVTAEQMQTMLKNGPVDKDTGKPAGLSTQLFGRVGSCAFIRITAPDTPHAHGDTSEIYVIQSGTASIETGGEMVGPFTANSAVHQGMFTNADGTARAPGGAGANGGGAAGGNGGGAAGNGGGARAGGNGGGGRGAAQEGGPHNGSGSAVAGGRTQVVKAGDVIMIPAGVPHHWVKVDEPIVYLDIKFPQAK